MVLGRQQAQESTKLGIVHVVKEGRVVNFYAVNSPPLKAPKGRKKLVCCSTRGCFNVV